MTTISLSDGQDLSASDSLSGAVALSLAETLTGTDVLGRSVPLTETLSGDPVVAVTALLTDGPTGGRVTTYEPRLARRGDTLYLAYTRRVTSTGGGSTLRAQIYLATSSDGGENWTHERVTDDLYAYSAVYLCLDSTGQPHLAANRGGEPCYLYLSGGVWQVEWIWQEAVPYNAITFDDLQGFALVNDVPHVLFLLDHYWDHDGVSYQDWYGIWHSVRTAGTWSAPAAVVPEAYAWPYDGQLFVDADDHLHFVVQHDDSESSTDRVLYAHYDGTWSTQYLTPEDIESWACGVCVQGTTCHILYERFRYEEPYIGDYQLLAIAGETPGTPETVSALDSYSPTAGYLSVDGANLFYVFRGKVSADGYAYNVYTATYDGTWSTPYKATGLTYSTGVDDLCVDDAGDVVYEETLPDYQYALHFANRDALVALDVPVYDALSEGLPVTFSLEETTTTQDSLGITRGDESETRNHPHTSKFYLAIKVPRVIWRGRVSADRTEETDWTIDISSGANVTGFDVTNFLPDLTCWIGTSQDAQDHGICRVKRFDGNNLLVSADMLSVWKAGDYVSITDVHELWARHHKVEVDGTEQTVWKDGDITERVEKPVPVMGPPVCAFLTDGTVSVQYDGTASYLVQPDSNEVPDDWTDNRGITAYSWWFEGGSPSTSTSPNPLVTYTTPGQYVVRLEVTGENSETDRGFRNVFIFDDAHPPLTDFSIERLEGSLENHGWEGDVTVFEDGFDLDVIPNNSQAVLFAQEYFNGVPRSYQVTDHDGGIKLVGWLADTRLKYGPKKVRDATMTLRGLQKYLQSESNYPVYWTEVDSEAPDWSYFDHDDDGLTVRKSLYHLIRWHWTITHFTDVYIPNDHNNYLPGQSFPEGTLGRQLDEFVKDMQSRWVVDRFGGLRVFSYPNYLPITGAGKAWREDCYSLVSWTEDDYQDIDILPRAHTKAARVRIEGVYRAGAYYYSVDMAPGDIRGLEGGTTTLSNQVLGTGGFEGSQGWELARMVYAEEAREIDKVEIPLMGNYSFVDLFPVANHFRLTAAPGTFRGIAWSNKSFWITGIQHEIDVEKGDIETTVTALPETYPNLNLSIYSESGEVPKNTKYRSQGGSGSFASLINDVKQPKASYVPALMGDGAGHVETEDGTHCYARRYGDPNQTVIVENRGYRPEPDRPILLEELPPGREGNESGPTYRVSGLRQANDTGADAARDRAYTRHMAVFCIPGPLEVSTAAAPTVLGHDTSRILKTWKARLQVAPVGGPLTMQLLKNGGLLSEMSIAAGALSAGPIALTETLLTDLDYLDLSVTVVGVTSPGEGLTVSVETWEVGV